MDEQENQSVPKKCPFCKEEISGVAEKCAHCGERFKKHSINPELPEYAGRPPSDIQPVWHFVLLSAATLGVYEIYWFYRNWKQLKAYKNLDISPAFRAIGLLVPVYGQVLAYEQLRDIRNFTEEVVVGKLYSPGLTLFGWLALTVLWALPHPLWFLGLLSVWPLASVQGALNSYWKKEWPGIIERTEFLPGEVALLVTGGTLLIFLLSGLFILK